MRINSIVTFTDRELQEVYSALCDRTARVINEEGPNSPKLTAVREARAKVAERIEQSRQIPALAGTRAYA